MHALQPQWGACSTVHNKPHAAKHVLALPPPPSSIRRVQGSSGQLRLPCMRCASNGAGGGGTSSVQHDPTGPGGSSNGGNGSLGPGGEGPGQDGEPPKQKPVWLQVWLWLCALTYLVARTVWRQRLAARQAEFEREQAAQQRADQEWAQFVDDFAKSGKKGPPPELQRGAHTSLPKKSAAVSGMLGKQQSQEKA